MERDIRATKRECMMLNETGDKEGFDKTSARLKAQKKKYSEYCRETGLKQHNDRTHVYGFDRSVSSKAVWAERKAKSLKNSLTSGVGSGMINKAKSIDLFNDSEISLNSPITAKQIIDELATTNIGRITHKDIENLSERIKLTNAPKSGDVRGKQLGDEITIYLSNCKKRQMGSSNSYSQNHIPQIRHRSKPMGRMCMCCSRA